MIPYKYLIFILTCVAYVYSESCSGNGCTAIVSDTSITYGGKNPDGTDLLSLYFDPPSGYFAPTALGVYVSCNLGPICQIYYEIGDANQIYNAPSLNSRSATDSSRYINIDTPFGATRARNLTIIAVANIKGTLIKSQQVTLMYYVEAAARKGIPPFKPWLGPDGGMPGAYGWLVPSVQSHGYFVSECYSVFKS